MTLLEMSAAGAVVILAVTAVRAACIDRLPKAVFTALWAVAVLRLLVPVSVPSPVSVYRLFNGMPAADSAAVPSEPDLTPPLRAQSAAPAAPHPEQDAAETARARRPVPWPTVVWAAGAVLCGAYFALGYLTALRRFREAVEVYDPFVDHWRDCHRLRRRVSVRLSGRVDTPVTYGLLRPVILLPADTDWRDRRRMWFILCHEHAHIRRLDGARKLILAATVCLHWFNPLVWLMFILANRDMEMACDEQVLRAMDGDGRADYARTLVDMAQARSGPSPLVSHFNESAMEERIKAIMKMKKWTAMAVMTSILLTLGVTAVFATAAPESEPAAAPAAYDMGGAQVLLPLTEAGLDAFFPDDDIQWWTAEDFAAWADEQRQLLQTAGGDISTSTAVPIEALPEQQLQQLLDAFDTVGQALEDGAKLSRTINGEASVVVAVGLDLGLVPGDAVNANAYDIQSLLWGVKQDEAPASASGTVSFTAELNDGACAVRFGPSMSYQGLMETTRAYLLHRVSAGAVSAEEADQALERLWSDFQPTQMPSELRVSAAALPAA